MSLTSYPLESLGYTLDRTTMVSLLMTIVLTAFLVVGIIHWVTYRSYLFLGVGSILFGVCLIFYGFSPPRPADLTLPSGLEAVASEAEVREAVETGLLVKLDGGLGLARDGKTLYVVRVSEAA